MDKNIPLPEIGEGVQEGELVKWLVQVGDSIKIDDGLCEILTDKATVEIPSAFDGKIMSLEANEGGTIKVGETLLVIKTQEASQGITDQQKPIDMPKPSESVPKPPFIDKVIDKSPEITPPVIDDQVLATPSTRRFAREIGIDINKIKGTGNMGRVTKLDVQNAKASLGVAEPQNVFVSNEIANAETALNKPKAVLEEDQVIKLKGIRRKIAQAMGHSKKTIPHFSLLDEVDVTSLVNLRSELKRDYPDKKITFLPFIMKALVLVIKKYPMINASLTETDIIYKKSCNIGFATDTPDGLIVPVIKNVAHKSILDISTELKELSQKAREGKLELKDLKDGTITITNIGSISGISATPIINHPEVAIIGVYKIKKTPVFKCEKFMPIDIMNISLTADHRLIDGAVAARCLADLKDKLENPLKMIVE